MVPKNADMRAGKVVFTIYAKLPPTLRQSEVVCGR